MHKKMNEEQIKLIMDTLDERRILLENTVNRLELSDDPKDRLKEDIFREDLELVNSTIEAFVTNAIEEFTKTA